MSTKQDERIARAVMDDMTDAVPAFTSNKNAMLAAAWAFIAFAEEDGWSADATACFGEILTSSATFPKGA